MVGTGKACTGPGWVKGSGMWSLLHPPLPGALVLWSWEPKVVRSGQKLQLMTTVTSIILKAREGKLKKDFHRRDCDKGAFRMLMEGRQWPHLQSAHSSYQDVSGASTATRELALHRGHQIWPLMVFKALLSPSLPGQTYWPGFCPGQAAPQQTWSSELCV